MRGKRGLRQLASYKTKPSVAYAIFHGQLKFAQKPQVTAVSESTHESTSFGIRPQEELGSFVGKWIYQYGFEFPVGLSEDNNDVPDPQFYMRTKELFVHLVANNMKISIWDWVHFFLNPSTCPNDNIAPTL